MPIAKYFPASEPGIAANESSGRACSQLQNLLIFALKQEKIGLRADNFEPLFAAHRQ